jgi:hypothetical protein
MSVPKRRTLWAALLVASVVALFILSTHSQALRRVVSPLREETSDLLGNAAWHEPVRPTVQSDIGEGIRTINLTVYEQGIFPRRIKVQPGRVTFSIDDRYGYASGLIISGAGHQRQIPKPAARRRWKGTIRLDVGTYVISDARRPDIRSDLIVSP